MSLGRIFGSGTKVHVHEISASKLRDKVQAKRAFFAQVQMDKNKVIFQWSQVQKDMVFMFWGCFFSKNSFFAEIIEKTFKKSWFYFEKSKF